MASVERTTSFAKEMLDFLASSPTPQQIVDLRVSAEVQQRMSLLLEKNRKGKITAEEKRELEENLRLERFMAALKSRVRRKQAE